MTYAVEIKDLQPGDVMCVDGQVGEFVGRPRKRKFVTFRPYGSSYTRERTPSARSAWQMTPAVRVERDEEWVEVIV